MHGLSGERRPRPVMVAFFAFNEPTRVYVSLPIGAALIGYITKVVAIEMLFRPLESRGLINPWLGWQGQLPRRAAKMAGPGVRRQAMVVSNLLRDKWVVVAVGAALGFLVGEPQVQLLLS